jgi:hypothetical protein
VSSLFCVVLVLLVVVLVLVLVLVVLVCPFVSWRPVLSFHFMSFCAELISQLVTLESFEAWLKTKEIALYVAWRRERVVCEGYSYMPDCLTH